MTAQGKKIEPRRLKGFRDYMPDLMETRSRFQAVIREHARLAGFREIGTPVLEYAETLLGQGSDETDKQVYRFEDHGERKVAMRFDLTVPFARFVAEHQGTLVFPFKRLQIGDVWRGENTQKGRYREFCQCDLDIIGVDSVAADIEILACFYRILCGFDLGGFTMRLGNRVLLSAMLAKVFPGIAAKGEAEALIALDKLDKIGQEGVVGLLSKIESASEAGAQKLIQVLLAKGDDGGTDRDAVRGLLTGHDVGLAELQRLETILAALQAAVAVNVGGAVRIDLSIARGLGYYTGVVFETTLDALPGFGSVSSGGRYNNLAERFTNRSLPGVGGSIGLDRLLAGLEEMGKIKNQFPTPVFIAVATEDALISASLLVAELRRNHVACDIGLTTGKLGHQFKHADRLGCRYVITLGTSEVEAGTYNLKDMADGIEQKSLPRQDILAHLGPLLRQS
jgi:histidyl-tRNA synthetase